MNIFLNSGRIQVLCLMTSGSDHIIQRRYLIHCARGPRGCAKCKEMAKEKKICLVKYYARQGDIARPMDYFEVNGEKQFMEFDIETVFNDEGEARAYAEKHSVRIDL